MTNNSTQINLTSQMKQTKYLKNINYYNSPNKIQIISIKETKGNGNFKTPIKKNSLDPDGFISKFYQTFK